MAKRTQLRGTDIEDYTIRRQDINYQDSGSAVILKVAVGPGLKITSTGADEGTGDVTIEMINTDLYLKDLLKNGASAAMNINGSVTPQTFQLLADASNDSYIEEVILRMEDSKINYKDFGAISTLANGFDLKIDQGGVTKTIIDKAKTTYDLFAKAVGDFDIVAGFDSSNNEAILIHVPLNKALLAAGTSDKIYAVVNDDLTGLLKFEGTVVYGRES